MVLPLIAGLLLAAGGTYALAGIVSHLIQPFSILAALVFGVGSFLYMEREELLQPIDDGDARLVAHGGVAAVIGLVVYKSVVWVLAGASVIVVLGVGALLLIGGPALLLLVVRGGLSAVFD